MFEGELAKIELNSDFGYGYYATYEEREQKLLLMANGQGVFNGYLKSTDDYHLENKPRQIFFKLNETVTRDIMKTFTTFFSQRFYKVRATDVGFWELSLTNTLGEVFDFQGGHDCSL